MSNLTVDYTGEAIPTQGLVTTPKEAAHRIMLGYVPANLKDLSTNTHFRDTVLGYILRDTTDHDVVLEVLCCALRHAAEEVDVRMYSEYVAAVAYSWEHPTLALKAISRNKPTNATTFIWSVAQAMYKKMPGPFYQTLIVSQLEQSEQQWANSNP
jgi:hypothetical protein